MTDFGDVPPLGNLQENRLDDLLARWQQSELWNKLNCHCPFASCAGPNVLVANSYYPDTDFKQRTALL